MRIFGKNIISIATFLTIQLKLNLKDLRFLSSMATVPFCLINELQNLIFITLKNGSLEIVNFRENLKDFRVDL